MSCCIAMVQLYRGSCTLCAYLFDYWNVIAVPIIDEGRPIYANIIQAQQRRVCLPEVAVPNGRSAFVGQQYSGKNGGTAVV